MKAAIALALLFKIAWSEVIEPLESTLVNFAETSMTAIKKSSYPKNKWTLVKKYPDILKLKGASMVSYENKLIIFGGCREDLTCSNTVYSFDIE